MQLFLVEPQIKWNQAIIDDKEILSQIRKVLRLKKGDRIFLQDKNIRYDVAIEDWTDKTLVWNVLDTINNDSISSQTGMIIAMPNKWQKAELIVQKLTEIWITDIIFRPTERSVIKEPNKNKMERLNKIAKEALEQSRWRHMPNISFCSDISDIVTNSEITIFDIPKETYSVPHETETKYWLIWPEGWLTDKDYAKLWDNIKIQSLWNTVLRTETAAIVAGWLVKNS